MPPIPPIKHSIVVDAPIERVWRALTTPEQVAVWVGAVGFQPHIGAKFEFHAPPQPGWDGITWSEVTALEPMRRLAFTWSVPNFPATMVEFSLRDLGGRTEVTVEHRGWEQFGPEIAPVRDGLDQGWGGHVLPNLKQLVEAT